jgi:hypothetical protein
MIASFFGIKIQDIGDTWESYGTSVDAAAEGTEAVSDALGDAAKAAKELKNAQIGIDELNVISPPSAGSGSGGAGGAGGGVGFDGLDVESIWDESIMADITSKVDAIKEKIKEWLPVIEAVGIALGGLAIFKLLDDLDLADTKLAKLEPKIKGLGKGLAIASIVVSVGMIIWDFTGAYLEEGGMKNLAKILGTTVLGAAVGAWLGKSKGAGLVLVTSAIVSLTRVIVELKEGSIEFSDPETLTTLLVSAFEGILGGALIIDGLKGGKWTKAIGAAIKGGLETAALKGLYALDGIKTFLAPLVAKIGSALSGLAAAVAAIPGWVMALIAAIVGVIVAGIVKYDFTEIGRKIGHAIGVALRSVADFGLTILEWLFDAFDWVKNNFTWDKIKEFLLFVFSAELWRDIVWDNMKKAGSYIVEGLWKGISGWAKNLWGNIKEFCAGFIEGFLDAFGIHSPSKVFIGIGEDIVAGLLQPLKLDTLKKRVVEIWNAAKKWWDSKPKLKEYTPTIGSIYEKVKERWDNARTWYNDKKSKMKEYTPSIGSIYEKAKERWDNARTWWNDKKAAMKTYTPSIGSIVDKIKSAWNTAKSWWNKNVGGLSTKLNVSVPKIKVKWDTAEAFGKSFKYPTGFKLEFAADGGIFDAGSLIWAGERGAEVVANAGGGKTGVMNVQQMQEAVYEGVYAAMSAAMGRYGSEGAQAVNVYLDSRQITSTVEQRQRERGASLMGKEVFG